MQVRVVKFKISASNFFLNSKYYCTYLIAFKIMWLSIQINIARVCLAMYLYIQRQQSDKLVLRNETPVNKNTYQFSIP